MTETAGSCTQVESKLASFLEEVNKDEKKNCFRTDKHILCLASLNLDSLPPSVLDMQMITALILDHNNLTQIPHSLCENLKLLQKLSLIGNELDSLPHNINILFRLTELHLTANKINKIPECIGYLEDLKILKLGDNLLKKLPSTIGCLTALIELDISENQLRKLPDSFCWLKNLEILDCSENKLKKLPINFGCLQELKTLNLESNLISNLPSSTSMFTNLEVLDLSGNKLTRLMPTLNCAHLIRKIYVNRNILAELPQWFNSVHKLEELSLRENRLQEEPFPKDFGKVASKLIKIDLAGNSIGKLCESFGELCSLQWLHLGSFLDELERGNFSNGNLLTLLPDNFGQLKSLRDLRLDENKITQLPDNFGCLVHLETLDLGQNYLCELPASFGDLKSLKMCQFSKNSLSSLPESFGNLSNLIDLRLDNNEITELPKSFFQLTRLQTLDLFNNKLTTIPTGLENLTNLSRLDLDENDFGLPVSEIPRIVYKLKYKERDPALKVNWRSRTPMASENVDAPREANMEGYELEINSLENALQQGSTIWKTEGVQEEKREKYVKIEKQEIPLSTQQEYDNEHCDEGDSTEDDHDSNSDAEPAENWDVDLVDKESESWGNEVMQFEFSNCPYDDYPVQKPSEPRYFESDLMNMHKHINQEMFCPSDIHAKPVIRGRFHFYQEEGQFDDAD